MSNDPITTLGLTCPSGGTFYICQDSPVQFLGCCDVDPCGDLEGACPSASLYAAGFNASMYSEIPAEACSSQDPSEDAAWYTCASGDTFLGCCTSNPCANGSECPSDDLVAAQLDSDTKNASPFLTSAVPSATSTSSSVATTSVSQTQTASASVTATPAASAQSSSQSQSATIGGAVGGSMGALVILGIIAFFFLRYRRRRRHDNDGPDCVEGTKGPQPPWSPYQDSFHSSPTLIQPGSPMSTSSTAKRSTHHRSISESLFHPIRAMRRSSAKDSSQHVSYDLNINYDGLQGERVQGLNIVAELGPGPPPVELEAAPPPIRELESPEPGRLPIRRSFHNNVYHEMQGSGLGR
ncbi:hypothetical protein F5Y15DRAFT_342623 [Xylariaceae sp. FL0016]|nr:hypothetical protein F5Y15DRAFT_342623 [Xylariaceae sp. FL0016]